MKELTLKLLTPERQVLERTVECVSIPTREGQITVLPGHADLVAILGSGELVAHAGLDELPLAITGGMVEVRGGKEVIIMADSAAHLEEIDLAAAEEAKRRAEEAMKGPKLSAQEYAIVAGTLERELARINLKRKYSNR